MKKTIILILLSISLVFTTTVSACSSGISKEQYDKVSQEAASLREKKAEAALYALFLDLLMYQIYKQENISTRFEFSTYGEWIQAMSNMATTINDVQLISLLDKMKKDPSSFIQVANYVISHIETTLQ
jgi:hypothetical protein